MEEKNYQITLSDGTIIGSLAMNGSNFISDEAIDPSIFNANCSPVIINDGATKEIHENMELVQITKVNGKYWFVLRDITRKEMEQAKIKSDIEYIAMMCDVEL